MQSVFDLFLKFSIGMVTLLELESCTMIKIVDIFWQMENASHEGGNPGENQ